jgi:hypothetical protein
MSVRRHLPPASREPCSRSAVNAFPPITQIFQSSPRRYRGLLLVGYPENEKLREFVHIELDIGSLYRLSSLYDKGGCYEL